MKALFLLTALMSATILTASTQDADLVNYLKECREVAMNADTITDGGALPMMSHFFKKNFEVRFADANYLSYYAEIESYTGGAHGMTEVTVGTLNRKTGEKVCVKDLVPAEKMPTLLKALREGAIQRLGGAEHLQDEVKATENFYVAADGLHFVYNPYEIACYAKGRVEVVIDLKKLGL